MTSDIAVARVTTAALIGIGVAAVGLAATVLITDDPAPIPTTATTTVTTTVTTPVAPCDHPDCPPAPSLDY